MLNEYWQRWGSSTRHVWRNVGAAVFYFSPYSAISWYFMKMKIAKMQSERMGIDAILILPLNITEERIYVEDVETGGRCDPREYSHSRQIRRANYHHIPMAIVELKCPEKYLYKV